MPSSGTPIENIFNDEKCTRAELTRQRQHLTEAVQTAMGHGMLVEWLESFVGAWNATKNVTEAINAGLIEWDM